MARRRKGKPDVIGGRYRVEEAIHRGPGGVVYLARDARRKGKKRFALKVLPPGEDDPLLASDIEEQFRILQELDHPHLARVHAVGWEGRSPYIVSEYVEGKDFVQAIRTGGLPIFWKATVETLRALGYLHSRDLLHGDLKPSNILLARRGVKVIDIGVESRRGALRRSPETYTLQYLSPEVIRGEEAGPPADLFSLGVTLYQALAGRLPFDGEDAEEILRSILEAEPLPLASLNAYLPPGAEAIIGKLLAKDPYSRFRAAGEVILTIGEKTGTPYPVETARSGRGYIYSGRMVARQDALGSLKALMGDETPTRLAVVAGETGLGKSRLARELQVHCQARAVPFFQGGFPPGRSPAYFPFREILRQAYGTPEPSEKEVSPPLASFLGLTSPEGPEPDPHREKERFFEAAAVAIGGPDPSSHVVVHLDDVHFGDPQTLALARYLLRRLPGLRLILSWDPTAPGRMGLGEEMGRLADDQGALRIQLEPLASEEVDALTRSMLGTALPPSVLLRLARATGGNPLLVTEVMRGLADKGILSHGAEGWTIDPRQADTVQLPADIREDLRARLETVPPSDREALEVLSLFRDPPTRKILDLLGVEDRIADLGRSGWVRLRSGRYEVYPPVVRSAVSGFLDPDRRERLHLQVGRALETSGGDPGEIAFHLLEGGDTDAGVKWGSLAARLYVRLSPPDAEETLIRLLALVPEEEGKMHLDLLGALSRALEVQGKAEDAIAAHKESIRLKRSADDDPAAISLAMARIKRLERDFAGVERHCLEGMAAAASGTAPSVRAELYSMLGGVLIVTGRPGQALDPLKTSLSEARRAGDEVAEARAHHNLALAHLRNGEPQKAAAQYEQALRTLAGRHPEREVLCLAGLADLQFRRGRYADVSPLLRRALELSTSHGVERERISALYNMGEASLHLGDVGAAVASWEESARLAEMIGVVDFAAEARSQMAGVRRLRSEISDAVPLARSAIRALRGASESTERPAAIAILGECYLDAGLLRRARRIGRIALADAERLGDRLATGKATMLLGRVAVAGEETARAREFAAMAKADFLSEGNAAYVAMADTLLARVSVRERRLDEARGILKSLKGLSGGKVHPSEQMDLVLVRAELQVADGDWMGAIVSAQDLLTMAEALGNKPFLYEAASILREATSSVGERSESRKYAYLAREAVEAHLKKIPGRWRKSSRWRTALEGVKKKMEEREAMAAGESAVGGEVLDRVGEIIESINAAVSLEDVLRKVVDGAVQIAEAERAFLVLQEGQGERFSVSRNFDQEDVRDPEVKISRTVLARCMESGEVILTTNAQEDGRFREYTSVKKLRLRSILCIPLRARGEILGAVYLDNRFRPAAFGQRERDLLLRFADLAALALQNHRLLRETRQSRETLRQDVARKDREVVAARRALQGTSPYDTILGHSQAMEKTFSMMHSLMPTEVPILIEGESGTGKELVARALHLGGPRREGPFLTINCSALTDTLLESELFGHVKGAFTGASTDREGLFRAADGGTLFLDEVADMSEGMQKKLLRVIQDGEVRPVGGTKVFHVDVRILAATNRKLQAEVRKGSFREDLYYRLATVTVDLPPLRDREEDMILLANHFLKEFCEANGLGKKRLTAGAIEAVRRHPWPGNIRELKSCVQKAALLSTGVDIVADDLGLRPDSPPGAAADEQPRTLEEIEREAIVRAIENAGGSVDQAAQALGLHRSTLYRKARKYNIPL